MCTHIRIVCVVIVGFINISCFAEAPNNSTGVNLTDSDIVKIGAELRKTFNAAQGVSSAPDEQLIEQAFTAAGIPFHRIFYVGSKANSLKYHLGGSVLVPGSMYQVTPSNPATLPIPGFISESNAEVFYNFHGLKLLFTFQRNTTDQQKITLLKDLQGKYPQLQIVGDHTSRVIEIRADNFPLLVGASNEIEAALNLGVVRRLEPEVQQFRLPIIKNLVQARDLTTGACLPVLGKLSP